MLEVPEMETAKYLTTKEVAELTGFSVKTLERWRHERRGPPALFVGRNVRYRSDAVRAWIEREPCSDEGGSNVR